MTEMWIATAIFMCLSLASLGAMFMTARMKVQYRDDDTNAVIRLIANIFVVMSSLVFGLMINSAKNTFENIDSSVRAFSTNIILLDRSLKTYGLAALEVRGRLQTYLDHAIANPARSDMTKPDEAGRMLYAVGDAILSLRPEGDFHKSLMLDIRQQYHRLVEQRWVIVEGADGVIPFPLIVLLAAWLTLIFASFGYRAPRHGIAFGSFVIAAFLIATAFYLVLDMDAPFHGPIQISDEPLRRALAELHS